jgi:hypothetical protein
VQGLPGNSDPGLGDNDGPPENDEPLGDAGRILEGEGNGDHGGGRSEDEGDGGHGGERDQDDGNDHGGENPGLENEEEPPSNGDGLDARMHARKQAVLDDRRNQHNSYDIRQRNAYDDRSDAHASHKNPNGDSHHRKAAEHDENQSLTDIVKPATKKARTAGPKPQAKKGQGSRRR